MKTDGATPFEEGGQIPDDWPLVALYRRDAFLEDISCPSVAASESERVELARSPEGSWVVHERHTRLHGGAWKAEETGQVLADAASAAAMLWPYSQMRQVDHAEAIEYTDNGWQLLWHMDTDDLGPYARAAERASFEVLDEMAYGPVREAGNEL